MAQQNLVNIGSDNGLLPESTKPLPVSRLTWLSARSFGIYMRTISQEMLKISILQFGMAQDCDISIPQAMEIPQFCTKLPEKSNLNHLMNSL